MNKMPLVYENTRRKHRVGQPVQVTTMNHFTYDLDQASKDLLRESARREGMPGYSNRSQEEIKDYLRDRNVSEIVFRVIKKRDE